MDFKQLEIFSVLANELHFAHTAKRCHMTASAVTRSIQRLEEELGYPLLERNNRSVELTVAGKTFADFAVESLQQYQRLKDSLASDAEAVRGSLSVYSSVTASYGILSYLLDAFRDKFPDVELQLHTGDHADAVQRVLQGEEDVAVAAMPTELPSELSFKTLTFSPLRFIMPVSGSVFDQVSELKRHNNGAVNPVKLPLIVAERGLARERLDECLALQSDKPNVYAQVSGNEAIVSMVALGCGVGLVPELVIKHSPFQNKIRIIEGAPELPVFQIGLCALQSRMKSPTLKALWDIADTLQW